MHSQHAMHGLCAACVVRADVKCLQLPVASVYAPAHAELTILHARISRALIG
jgi:hypothetical protein